MSNYVYLRHLNQSFDNRFNIETNSERYRVNGLTEWVRLISMILELLQFRGDQQNDRELSIRRGAIDELVNLRSRENLNLYERREALFSRRSTEEILALLLLALLKQTYPPFPRDICPRLFISHRQTDKRYALRIAQIAAQANFAYWVDELDPHLQILQKTLVPYRLRPIITACIIEMALINCTHVIACMTPDTRGSLWVPYEYGRITELPRASGNTCAWVHPGLIGSHFPDYMWLGELTYTETEIQNWLAFERQLFTQSGCNPTGGDLLTSQDIELLPEF